MTVRVSARGNRLASVGQKIVVTVDGGNVTVKAPFYRRSIPIADITAISTAPDDGKNHGLLNWFVTGRADARDGVRLNNGGAARIDILTKGGARYGVVVDTLDQATQIIKAIEVEALSPSKSPENF